MAGGKRGGKGRRANRGRRKTGRKSAARAAARKKNNNRASQRAAASLRDERDDRVAAVQHLVFSKVSITEKIMEFYFDDSPSRGADVSPFGMTSTYWLSCHDHFVGRHTERLVRAWFEECCDDTGIFHLHRSCRGKKFHATLQQNHMNHEWVDKLLTGVSAVCFSDELNCVKEQSEMISNVNVMALLQIISDYGTNESEKFAVAVSTARHLMAQWMYMSIGDWRTEMERAHEFKTNLVEMCSSLKKAALGGCRPAANVLKRGRMLFHLAVAFERKDVDKVKRIIRLLQ